jgi:hypothetical protein
MDIMHDDGSTNLKLDLNGSVTVTAKDDGIFKIFSEKQMLFESPKIYIGKEDNTEPLALGESLRTKLNELIDAFNQHFHPTPAGPSSAPTAPFTSYVKTDFLSEVSFTIKEF